MASPDGPEARMHASIEAAERDMQDCYLRELLADDVCERLIAPVCMAEDHWKQTGAVWCFACGERLRGGEPRGDVTDSIDVPR
jgi:hypothetical protein